MSMILGGSWWGFVDLSDLLYRWKKQVHFFIQEGPVGGLVI